MIRLALALLDTNSSFKHYACTQAGRNWYIGYTNYPSCVNSCQ